MVLIFAYYIQLMVNYRRAYRAGGTWFFTVNLLQRQQNDLFISQISLLKVYIAIRKVYTNLSAITLKANRGYAGCGCKVHHF